MLLAASSLLSAQIQLTAPSLPLKETYTYQRITEEENERVYIELELLTDASSGNLGHSEYYEYRMRSRSKDMMARLLPDTLEVFRSEVWQKDPYSTIHRVTEVVDQNKTVAADELLICDINGLEMSLRGFPWNSRDKANLVFLTSSDEFQFKMSIKEGETLRLNGTLYNCYEVELALGGFLGSFFPKSCFWYSMDSPHILVKAESAGMMGADSYTLELLSYSAEE